MEWHTLMVQLIKLRNLAFASLLAPAITMLFFTGIVIADDPTVSIEAPSHEIGDVGAALGNVWDMDSTSDIVWTQPDASNNTVSYSVAAGLSGAYGSALRGEHPTGSDLASAFYTDSSVSIPSGIYRYLLYRAWIAPQETGEGGRTPESTNGRVLYTTQWGTPENWETVAYPHRRYSKPFLMYEQPDDSGVLGSCEFGEWCLYYFDLTTDMLSNTSPNSWDWGQPGTRVEAFGIWPHENWADWHGQPSGDTPNYFYLDFAYLTGDIVTSQPSEGSEYTVKWRVNDVDGGVITSTLYYQESDELRLPADVPTCDAGLTGWTIIPAQGTHTIDLSAALGPYQYYLPTLFKTPENSTSPFGSGEIGPYNQTFVWDLSSTGYTYGKVYYVCVEAEDSDGNKSYAVSSAPVIKVPEFAYMRPFD